MIRTKAYHDYKSTVARRVAIAMEDTGVTAEPPGTLYRASITYSCIGWGVDVDNSAKAILDALIGVAIADDKAIVELHVKKNTHARKESLTIELFKIGFREVPPPARKRTAVKKPRDSTRVIRKKRPSKLRKKGAGRWRN